MKSSKIDDTTREIVIFTHNLKSRTSAKEADAKKRVAQAKTAFGKEGMSRSFYSFKEKFLHSCIKIFINFRVKHSNSAYTTEQFNNPSRRYVCVTSHSRIAFVLVVPSKR